MEEVEDVSCPIEFNLRADLAEDSVNSFSVLSQPTSYVQ
jgi:hypothetical protein